MRHSLVHRSIALIVLVSFLGTGTAAVPALLSLVVAFDGGHSVLVKQSEGGAQVVLHHQAGCFTPRTADHPSGLMRGIVRICQPDREGDHCLSAARITSGYERGGDDAFHPQEREEVPASLEHAAFSADLDRATIRAQRERAIANEASANDTGFAATLPLLI